MEKDALLESFREFEINSEGQSQILGGLPSLNGCSQQGSNSYGDYISSVSGQQRCDVFLGSNDASDWCSSKTFQ
jgi:hypothetical protein